MPRLGPGSNGSLEPHPRLEPHAAPPKPLLPLLPARSSRAPESSPQPPFLQETVGREGEVLALPAPTPVCANSHAELPATASLPGAKRLEKSSGGGPRKDCSEAPFPEEEIAEPRAFCPVLHPSPPPTASAFAPSSQRHLRTLNQFCFSPCLFPVPQTKDYRCSGEPEV